jgi:hypothetical protein
MITETINRLMDAVIRGTLCGLCLGFCLYGVIAVWKWFFGVSKRFLHYLFPGCRWFKSKQSDKDTE